MKGMGYGELDNNEKHGWMGLVAFFYPSVYWFDFLCPVLLKRQNFTVAVLKLGLDCLSQHAVSWQNLSEQALLLLCLES